MGALRRGALRIVVGTSGRRAALTLTATARVRRAGARGTRTVRVASRRLTFREGRARAVSVPLTREGRRLLRARRVLRLTVRVTASDATARPRAQRTLTLQG